MKKIKYLLIASVISILLNGCFETTKYVYIQPEYTKLKAPRTVSKVDNSFIRNECLWLDNHSTNLCGNDLSIIMNQIISLRNNEKTCINVIHSYNEFVDSKSSTKID